MKLKKRGAIEIQFNWIFILIAGAVILLFFGTIITKQRGAAEQRLSASLLVDLESIMIGSSVTPAGLNAVPFPQKDIGFEGCDFYCIGKKKGADTKLKKNIKEKVIFTPDVIKVRKHFFIWTLPWNIPYRITNFLYLISPQVRYIIVYDPADLADSDFADAIKELLPPESTIIYEEEYTVMFREDAAPSSTFSDLNNYKVKFILIDQAPAPSYLNNFKTEDISAVNIDPSPVNKLNYGDLEFYKKTSTGWSSPETSSYFGEAALIGAIFAEDRETYECAVQNAFKRMSVVSEIYEERVSQIINDVPYSPGSACEIYYNSGVIQKLIDIKNAPTTYSDFDNIIDEIEKNQIINQNKNCILVY